MKFIITIGLGLCLLLGGCIGDSSEYSSMDELYKENPSFMAFIVQGKVDKINWDEETLFELIRDSQDTPEDTRMVLLGKKQGTSKRGRFSFWNQNCYR